MYLALNYFRLSLPWYGSSFFSLFFLDDISSCVLTIIQTHSCVSRVHFLHDAGKIKLLLQNQFTNKADSIEI